jgi:regulatory protein
MQSEARERRRGRRVLTTRAELEARALAYLDRYAATRARLASVLRRALPRPTDDPELRASLEATLTELLDRYTSAGLLDDARFAEARASSLRARGTSARRIQQKLAAQGVPAELVRGFDRPSHDDELTAARAYVARRRLGPCRSSPEARAAHHDRDLRALARQGFSFRVARLALGSTAGDRDDAHVDDDA